MTYVRATNKTAHLYRLDFYILIESTIGIFNKKLYIYYGAADKRICAASLNLSELLDDLIEQHGPQK